jgi:pilus assembly protein FimV
LLNNWILLAAGGGGIVAILAGFLFWRRRRAMAQEEELSTLTPPSTTGGTTSLMDNSVVRQPGGQSLDTMSSQTAQTDFSQAGPGSIDTDEVDPVAEADVYMAYGRDAQAEEILLDARQKDPGRVAIGLKLLEIYSGRKDVKQFEALATDLYGQTGGVGGDWNKVAAMGRVLDPNNPVYRGIVSAVPAGAATPAPAPVAPATPATPVTPAAAPAAPAYTGTVGTATAVGKSTAPSSAPPIAPPTRPIAGAAPAAPQGRPPAAPRLSPEVKADLPNLDFDIGTRIAPLSEEAMQENKASQSAPLDFDLGGDTLTPDTLIPADQEIAAGQGAKPAVKSGADQMPVDDGVEFDVSLTESTFLGRLPRERPVDMASIDLDLQSPELDIADLEPQPSTKTREDAFREVQVSTAVNPVFATEQMETVLTPAMDFSAQSETTVNADFATEQMKTQVVSDVPASQAETAFNYDLAGQHAETIVGPADQAVETASEEVATKLDLARAYEEMGDVEGARELLQEVLKEGNASQRETAQSILAKLGG